MTIEHDHLRKIDEMRQEVAEWIENRPTIKHTQESLFGLMYGEVNELNRAIIEGESKDRITSEVGDVFFSLLAIETMTGPKYSEQFANISKYCKENKITLSDLFNKTWYKNNANYTVVLFNEMSPFADPKNAISCLRILRHAINENPKTLNEFWQYTEHLVFDGTSFFDGYVAIGKLRGAIKSRLKNITTSQNRGVDLKTKQEIDRLIKIGEWSMAPLDIPNNKYNWSSW
jgi:NTP pyrophosphatase (non-canonical NTP hydrolase)